MNKNVNELKHKFTNTLMKSGNKKTVEKVLIKSFKLIQKLNRKNNKNLIKNSIINSTLTFKLSKQSKKKGKRKLNKEIPSFIKKDTTRTLLALNCLVTSASKNNEINHFYKKLSQEILDSSFNKGKAIEKKNEIQKQVLMQKRYLLNFRW